MLKTEIDWANLGFGYIKTDKRFVTEYKDGHWDEGILSEDENVVINECACVLQYAQTCFEGMKAYMTKDNHIVVFRPELNADRLKQSCERLEMPIYPKGKFLEAVDKLVIANEKFVPPYGYGASLYLRPYMFGTTPVMGVKPASEYQFRIIASPVGPYFKTESKALNLCISDFDRSAPRGTGNVKAGLNYAMSMHPYVTAHKNGFDENVYLDAKTRTKIEETGGANIIFVTEDKKLVVPMSDSILPSITRRSLVDVAKNYLNLEVEEREVFLSELSNFTECGLCGTAAVISPVGTISDKDNKYVFPNSNEKDSVMYSLKKILTAMQYGEMDAPEGWIRVIK